MAILTALVNDQRELEGDYQTGKRKGEKWHFLSLALSDTGTGFPWSCQLPSEDKDYTKWVGQNLIGHKIKVKIKSQSASERTLPNGQVKLEIRSRITVLEDLGAAPVEVVFPLCRGVFPFQETPRAHASRPFRTLGVGSLVLCRLGVFLFFITCFLSIVEYLLYLIDKLQVMTSDSGVVGYML